MTDISAAPAAPGRLRRWLTLHRFAQLCLLVLPLIVVRTAGEYLRLKWAGNASLPALIDPLFVSLAGVGAGSIVATLLFFFRRDGWVVALTLAGIVALVVYKLMAMPALA